MRRHAQRKAQRARGGAIARDINIPLPLQGVFSEAKSAEISGMYAGELTNWQSNGASLRLRSQYSLQRTGNSASQRIPFEYGAAQEYIRVTENQVLAGTQIVDRTFAEQYKFAYISNNVIMVDGAHDPLRWNGADFSEAGFTTSTDIRQDMFDGIIAHQDRPFLWRTGDELDFYYGDVGAITGPLERFPLGRLGNITGSILALKSLTVDSGDNLNDQLAILTTTGGIVTYQGLNPGDAADWQLTTRLKVSPPIAKEAFVEVGGDLWMLTASGVVSVLQTIRNASLALVNTVTRPVQDDLTKQIKEGGEWSMHRSADAKMIIINRVYNGAASQFIYRTETKSWDFTDFPARSWHNIGLDTQFTTLDGGLATLSDDGSFTITARWVSSWFRVPNTTGITYIHPTIIANGPLTVSITLLSDHDETSGDIAEAEQTVTIEPDDPADPGGRVSLNEIIGVDAVGDTFQIQMEVSAQWAELVNMKAGVL